MIDMRYKPSFLPQVSAPLDMVLEKLRDEDVGYELIKANPNDLNPSQGITFSDDIDGIELDDISFKNEEMDSLINEDLEMIIKEVL